MTIEEIKKGYGLKDDVDFWYHTQSKKYIIKHDAVEKIANIESIRIIKIECLTSTETLVRFLVSMGKLDKDGKILNAVTTVGEADTSNCRLQGMYLGCMAEKRGVDRAVLKIMGLYDIAMSEDESDSFDYKHSQLEKEIVSFGKYRGLKWSEVDYDYLEWLSTKCSVDWQKELGKKELDRRNPKQNVANNTNQNGIQNTENVKSFDSNKHLTK
tara:strand:+ start:285 stop:923 length:639 start_codon:yes stop_codon:yes gene_type:complete